MTKGVSSTSLRCLQGVFVILMACTLCWIYFTWNEYQFIWKGFYESNNARIPILNMTVITKAARRRPTYKSAQHAFTEFAITSSEDVKPSHKLSHTPLILMWRRPFGKPGYGPPANVHCGCNYTYDHSLALVSDAVVIYCREADILNLPPDFPNRSATQKYVWWCREPPTHVLNWKLNMSYRRGFFNWTMSYRRDSDVATPWGLKEDLKSIHKEANISLEELIAKKSKIAIAIVSNCGSASVFGASLSRIKLIREMQKVLPIDGYGACFAAKLTNDAILEKIAPYKFFIAFENSYHCTDYITEKFWSKALLGGAVPVVWGPKRDDYEAVAPKSSFIFAEDFESVQELAEYLKYLNNNDTAYMKYLNWRSLENIKNSTEAITPPMETDFVHACALCRRLLEKEQLEDNSESTVDSIEEFIFNSNDKVCLKQSNKNDVLWRYDRSERDEISNTTL